MAKEKTFLAAAFLSAFAPLATGIAAFMGNSSTQYADFARRTVEFLATFMSWFFARRIRRHKIENPSVLESAAGFFTGGSLVFSGTLMAFLSLFRWGRYEVGGKVVLGLFIGLAGLFVNAYFLYRYKRMVLGDDVILDSQISLYRAKVAVDFAVTAALLFLFLYPESLSAIIFDGLSSLLVSFYLVYSGIVVFRKTLGRRKTYEGR